MCGRIALHSPPAHLSRLFDAALAAGVDPNGPPRWNVGPTADIYAVVDAGRSPGAGHTTQVLDRFRWGLIRSGAREPTAGSRMFNARSETVASRPAFREAFRRRRAVVPADGFFEWVHRPGDRRPFYFRRADGRPLALAGLWEVWRARSGAAAPIRSVAIITTQAGPDVAGVHDRMPVVLDPEAIDAWLDPTEDLEVAEALLQPAPTGTLVCHPVDRRVGNVANDGPELLTPVEDGVLPVPTSTPTLFD